MEKILACVLAIALLLTMSSCRTNEESATEKTTLIPAAVEEDAEETSGEQEEAAERSDPDKAGETAMSETPVKPSVPGDQGLTEQSETAVPEKQQNKEEVQQASFTQQHFTLRNGRVIGYWLYTPAGAVENMPLILYLHGGSGKGDDLELVTQADSLPQYLQNGQLAPEAYVLILQLPAGVDAAGQRGAGKLPNRPGRGEPHRAQHGRHRRVAAGASVSGQLLCDCAAERQRTGQRRKCLQAAQSACMGGGWQRGRGCRSLPFVADGRGPVRTKCPSIHYRYRRSRPLCGSGGGLSFGEV